MTLKQLAERIGVTVKDIDIELHNDCKACKKFGGHLDCIKECGERCFLLGNFCQLAHIRVNKGL